MGSIDIRNAKRQFLALVNAVNSRQLSSFTIWVDAKLAEFKVNGIITEESEQQLDRQYPEWITKSMRENLSVLFSYESDQSLNEAPTTKTPTHKETQNTAAPPVPYTEATNSSQPQPALSETPRGTETESDIANQTNPSAMGDFSVVVKEEISSDTEDEPYDMELPDEHQPLGMFSSHESANASQTHIQQPSQSEIQQSEPQIHQQSYSQPVFSGSHHQGAVAQAVSSSAVGGASQPAALPSFSTLQPGYSGALPHTSTVANSAAPAMDQQVMGSQEVASETSSSEINTSGQLHSSSFENPIKVETFETIPNESNKFQNSDFLHSKYGVDGKVKRGLAADPRSYKCYICQKGFRNRRDVHRHIKSHTGERQYKCPYCAKTYRHIFHCHRHQRSHHTDKPLIKDIKEMEPISKELVDLNMRELSQDFREVGQKYPGEDTAVEGKPCDSV